MSNNEKNQITERDILEFSMPLYTEIPDVGLYLKQVVKYINETVGEWFDIKVTETMLTNYVKMHMVPNAIKKQYYRDHIVIMIFIVLAKTVVSLDNIQKLLQIREQQYEVKEAYELFSGAFMRTLGGFFGKEQGNLVEAEAADQVQALVKNIIIAIIQKYHIEKSFRELTGE
ncbi:MAG: DUF1836 domain-containing protein [Lachnospiraceae bacterium]|nr:DUF1836 domain-containing protein [Lachnospiraceae bacterium]